MKFNTKDHPRHFLKKTRYVENKTVCNLCEAEIQYGSTTFDCRTCQSHFHESCLTIDKRDVHDHSLFFIRRQNSVVCNVCGLVGADKINMYTCVPCDFFAHRNCIFSPRDIKITRHSHRLVRTSITDEKDCKICQERVSENYQGYTCSEKRCDYVTHVFCATRSEVWDGQVPIGERVVVSELDDDDQVEIDGVAIHHFSHDYKLTRLHHAGEEKMDQLVCQSCILPIDMGGLLYCKGCEFALHDTCGRLPRRIEHMLHRHPLILEGTKRKIKERLFTCSVCDQDSCGFMYRCYREDCEFYMDVTCASFVEPFNHTAHQHPLFLEQQFDNGSSNQYFKCIACDSSSTVIAACSDPHCHFSLDMKCATLPGLLQCTSHDSHPLTLSLARVDDVHNATPSSPLWCEMCEEKIKKTNLFYMCNACCTTIHVECLLGKNRYIKPRRKIIVNGVEVDIVSNNMGFRPYCHECQRLCLDELVFIKRYTSRCFCSTKCLRSFIEACPFTSFDAVARYKKALEMYQNQYRIIGNTT